MDHRGIVANMVLGATIHELMAKLGDFIMSCIWVSLYQQPSLLVGESQRTNCAKGAPKEKKTFGLWHATAMASSPGEAHRPPLHPPLDNQSRDDSRRICTRSHYIFRS